MLHERKRQGGFTVIELMVVITILAIVVAFAVPGLREVKKAGNESVTISALRTLSSGQEGYRARYGGYGGMATLETAGYVDETYAMAPRHGYIYNDGAVTPYAWSATADPESTASGDRYFYIDQSNVIRESTAGTASATDSAI